jgi:hypothetical protein
MTQVVSSQSRLSVDQRSPATGSARKPTVAIAVPYAVNVRDVLRTDVFRTLKASGVRLVILSPAHAEPAFVEEFGSEDVAIEPLHGYVPRFWEEKLSVLRLTLFSDLTETFGMFSVPKHGRSPVKKMALASARAATKVVGRRAAQDLLGRADLALFPEARYDSFFERHRPDLVCLTRVMGASADYALLKSAVRYRVPTVLLASSWDNLTSKGIFPVRTDRIVVWNSIMAEEAESLHGFRRDHIYVAGAPQFDLYADKSALPDRQSFFRRIGADPGKALVTFAMSNVRHCPDEFDVVEMLWEAMQAGRFGRPCQLLARAHPIAGHYGDMFPARLKGRPDLLVDVPGRPGAHVDRDTSLEDMKHLAATMWHSNVVINTSSTTAIDAAALDTPVISAGFDGRRTLPYAQSVRRYHDYTHYKKLLALNGVKVVHSIDELVGQVRAYLDDPSLDREGRARVVERQCLTIDGKSGERIARYVLRFLGDVQRQR